MSNPTVTIGVPVYQGARYLKQTLQSIQDQSYQEILVMISLDGHQADCERICSPFLKDSRFQMVVQPQRLGWVGNLNWLMAQVETPFWYCNPQDDLVDPLYVEILLKQAQLLPEAAVVYSDLISIGQRTERIRQQSIAGRAFTRQLTILLHHLSAVAFRGLTRLPAIRQAGEIPANETDSFAADTTWMAAMARWGDLIRVPAVLYQKRYHDHNEHMKWFDWSPEKKNRAWLLHCVDLLEQALAIPANPREYRLLWLAGVERLLSQQFSFLPRSELDSQERRALFQALMVYLQTSQRMDLPELIGQEWSELHSWTEGFFWPA
jgi:hypothetical protein